MITLFLIFLLGSLGITLLGFSKTAIKSPAKSAALAASGVGLLIKNAYEVIKTIGKSVWFILTGIFGMGAITQVIVFIGVLSVVGGAWVAIIDEPTSSSSSDSSHTSSSTQQSPSFQGDIKFGANAPHPGQVHDQDDIQKYVVQASAYAMSPEIKALAQKNTSHPQCFKYRLTLRNDACYFYCTSFVMGLYHSIGLYPTGQPIEGTPFKFGVDASAKLENVAQQDGISWILSSSIQNGSKGKKYNPNITVKSSQDFDKLQPGDMLVTSGHTMMYVGVYNSKHFYIHASMPNATVYCSPLDDKPNCKDVGYATLEDRLSYSKEPMVVIRPSLAADHLG